MANSLYHNAAGLMFGDAGAAHTLPDWSSPGGNGIKAHLLDAADHTTNLSTDVDEADITDGAIVATATLASPTVAAGVFDAADTTFSAVTGDEAEEITLWHDTATDTTSPLLVNFDTFTSGMPVTPNGGDITVQWNGSGIVSLV